MTNKKTKYIAKKPDAEGFIHYTEAEHQVWQTLFNRQLPTVEQRACSAYLTGLEKLNLTPHHTPQCNEVSARLRECTGWSITPVEALISFDEFYTLLANKQFPAASFIRVPEELDYLQEPDIFHEIFGHCPLLTDQAFADFTQAFGEIGLRTPKVDRAMLARLYWFTVEFGLINTPAGLRIYGGGILSSYGETLYALDSSLPVRQSFDALTALRTPYRYDIMQTNYFVINDFNDFYPLVEQDLPALIKEARELGDLPANFPLKPAMEPFSC